jgi:ATP-dependent helicase hrpA
VFLPGEREIREAADVLRKSRPSTTEILPLFARLTAAEQERVFRPSGARRIVLSTNVAETSITVPGIRFVVDTGLARVKRYSYRNKVEQLQIEPVSQASANQRAGRCGRVADGICIRLYSEDDFARRPAFTDPEILRSNLAAVILRAISLKLGDVREFPFVQTPPPRAIADGFAILQELNAVTEEGELTRVGRELARLPVDPRLGRMLLAGSEQGSLEELLTICAGLSIQDPRERPADAQQAADEAHRKLADEKSDFLSYVKLWNWYEKANAEKESNRKLEAELHRRYLSVRRLREWRDVRRQLVQLTDELGWRRNTSPATFEQVHRALLTGLLGNIGSKAVESDFRAPPYLGARGIKFWIWPGSARAKKAGRWILAAEIVETSRMFARCVADIEPEWIEAAAGDLLRRNWTEPHWEKSRGEVVAFERGTLYGLTIYQQRRVSFAPHDPKLARELFIRQALVEGEWDGRAEFYAHNARLVREIQDLEHKTRRPDVLVDDELMFAFYDERIPADVVSTPTLLKWLKATSRDDPKALFMSRDELMRHDASGVTNRYFPKTMEMAGISMALNYHFEPGSPRDGLTLAVPLYALNQLDAVRAEWLVPGMVKEKAQTLLKSLPQKIRRHCVPIADFAGGFFTRTKEGEPQAKGFLEALADDVRSQTGVPCTVGDFKLEQLPPHLIMNFKVLDEHGRQIGMGRNLAQLRAEFGEAAQETFRHVAQEDAAVAKDLEDGITDWTFGELPELMEISRRGQTLIGHPALTDRGTDCAIEVYDDPLEARREHRKGLLRLFRLALREQVKFVERTLRDLGRVQMQAQTVPGLSRLFESADMLSTSVVDCALEATALAEPWPHDEASFRERREDVKGRLTLVAGEISRLLIEIVTEAAGIPLKLRRLSGEKALTDDIEAQLNDLFRKDFLTTVPLSQLAHYPRYLRAVHYRLDRYRDDPVRDESRRADIERLSVPLMRARAARRGQPDSRLDEFGWMLQELRVSLFAQQLRTPMPVSVKRLERVWMSITRL